MQNLVTIWRVENSEGQGLRDSCLRLQGTYKEFDCRELLDIQISPDDDEKLWPHFSDLIDIEILEEAPGEFQKWIFGFESLEHYARWLPNAALNRHLMEEGFLLKAFQINPEFVKFGDTQCVFYLPEAQQMCCKSDLG